MGAVPQAAAGLRPFSWRDVRVEAEAELARARAEAEGILVSARAEAERIRAGALESRAKGEAEGREAGRAEVLAQIQTRLDAEIPAIREAFRGVAASLEAVPARIEAESLDLALAVAALIVKREIALDPALVSGNLRAALEALVASGRITARVHPEDKALLEPRLGEALRGLGALERLELVADPSVARGGCIASSRGASADASVEGQLAEIRKTLLGEGA